MKRSVKIDPFFDNQPEQTFLTDLTSPVHPACPAFFCNRTPESDEVSVAGTYLLPGDFMNEPLLETSFLDFDHFLKICSIHGSTYPIRLIKDTTSCFEAYRIHISETETTVIADDTEGIRRALIWLEDEMQRREGPYLPLGTVTRKPRMRSRITRCFFSPINRPPKYGDELSDDIDYYPEEYLNRLMHDGANGVWIYTRFSDLVTVSALPSYGAGRESRIAKLNNVIALCARYGIKVYVFAIEPVALTEDLSQQLPETDGGIAYNGNHLFCVNTPEGRTMIEEAGRHLFTDCPNLGGFISITYGERPTSCSSAYESIPAIDYHHAMTCPRCKDLTPGQAVANAAAALAAGIHQANPDAEVISWTYGHRFWDEDAVRDYVHHATPDAILMQNFEEMGYAEQLGRTRQGVDYWLSYAGPSPLFRWTAEEAQPLGKTLYMKTQVCCSHEIATVPYVPVPGILFDKYKAAYELGVSGVMQCWYFGNYPSIMSKAAGELAFAEDLNKNAFLQHLAGLYVGRSHASQLMAAWQFFEKGYAQYPLNIMFSYYGPMHDGPVWELQLKPKNFSLPRSWQTLDPTDGDRIGECLMHGHTLEEALELTASLSRYWSQGTAFLQELLPEGHEQLSVARTLDLLFASGHAVLQFYNLREQLGLGPLTDLAPLRRIVLEERQRSLSLIPLWEADNRLGYHSEGEGFKFFTAKLRHRIASLDRLLETEFPEVEQRLADGLPPLEYYTGIEPDSTSYVMDGHWEPIGDHAAFRADYDSQNLIIELYSDHPQWFHISPEFRLFWPEAPVVIHPGGRVEIPPETYLYYSIFGDRIQTLYDTWRVESDSGTRLRITLDRRRIGWTEDRPFKMRYATEDGSLWCKEENPIHTLGRSSVSPGEYGWMLPYCKKEDKL